MNAVVVETTETTVAPMGDEPKRRSPHILNLNQINNIDIAAKVARAAQTTQYESALNLRNISVESINELVEEIQFCRQELAATLSSSTNQRSATVQERDTRSELIDAIQVIQAAARQKHTRTQPEQLKVYFIGEALRRRDRASLVQIAESVLQQLSRESLPGITPEIRAVLKQKCDAYVAADAEQQKQLSATKDHRVATLRHLKRLTDLRLEIQFAVDGLYPYPNLESASTRSEFGLPLRRPFVAK